MDASIDRLRELYSLMCLERRMSEIMAGRNRRTQSKQRPYLISIHHVGSRPGQEAVAPAVCLALRRLPDGADPPDMVVGTLGASISRQWGWTRAGWWPRHTADPADIAKVEPGRRW